MVGFTNNVRSTGTTGTNAATSTNSLTPTSAITRNASVKQVLADMAQQAKNGSASSVNLLFAKGVKAEGFAFNYHTGLAKQANLLSAPSDGIVRATVCINVSGHDQGRDPTSVDKYAASNTYNVRVQLPDGQVLQLNNVARNNPNSKEYATAIDIQFPYMKGETIIQAWPTGSAGVYGYVEGREYHIHSADQPFDSAKALKDALAKDAQAGSNTSHTSTRPFREF